MYANPEQFLIYQSEIDLFYYYSLKIGIIFSFERTLITLVLKEEAVSFCFLGEALEKGFLVGKESDALFGTGDGRIEDLFAKGEAPFGEDKVDMVIFTPLAFVYRDGPGPFKRGKVAGCVGFFSKIGDVL